MKLNRLVEQIDSRRSNFDPNNQDHLQIFKSFLEQNKWGGSCPFYLEWPHTSIPDMIKDKIVKNLLNVNQMETV